jgi:hypothetical protein
LSLDNEAALAWLNDALGRALEDDRPELLAYLEAVMDEVRFEIKGSSPVVTYPTKGV